MYVKAYKTQGGLLVAACDRELLGKKLREGSLVLDLDSHAGFYRGEAADEAALEKMLSSATNANLVGRRAVGCALRLGLAKKSEVKEIAGVEHLQIYCI